MEAIIPRAAPDENRAIKALHILARDRFRSPKPARIHRFPHPPVNFSGQHRITLLTLAAIPRLACCPNNYM